VCIIVDHSHFYLVRLENLEPLDNLLPFWSLTKIRKPVELSQILVHVKEMVNSKIQSKGCNCNIGVLNSSINSTELVITLDRIY
jgi:hypothetical protein